jgi:hypothetical protein
MLDNPKAITELTDILDRDIETIVAMRLRAERKVSRHQRLIEKVSSALGQPGAVYSIILLVVGRSGSLLAFFGGTSARLLRLMRLDASTK